MKKASRLGVISLIVEIMVPILQYPPVNRAIDMLLMINVLDDRHR